MMGARGLRIAHVNDIAFVASTLAIAQRRRGDHAAVFETPKPGARRGPFTKWLLAPIRALGLAGLAVRLRLGDWDIVHVHYASHAMVGAWSGRPYVVHCHGSDVRGVSPRSARGWLLSRYLRQAAVVLYSTPDLQEWVTWYRPDARLLPNPIDVDLFQALGEPTEDLLLGVRLDPVKGAETAILAAARLAAERPDLRVTVIEQGSLLARAHEALQGRATFMAPLRHADLPPLLAAHRVVLGQFKLGILSQLELEAMACGALVVATMRYAEVFDEPAPISQVDDAESAVRAVAAALGQDAASAVGLRERRRAWVVAHHGAASVADLLDAVYPRGQSGRGRTRQARSARRSTHTRG